MYVYIKTEPTLWTVGFYDPQGKFQPESDHETPGEAAARVCVLNGGNLPYILALQKIARAHEQDWGYVHPERKMVQLARDTLGLQWNSDFGRLEDEL